MMDKNIGFRRNIYLAWMDAVAAFCSDAQDLSALRVRLDPIVAPQVPSKENRRMAIDILINIWAKSAVTFPLLQAEAVRLYAQTSESGDRLWLHYGMTLLTYGFFRFGCVAIGQISRHSEVITPKDVKGRMISEMGPIGALDKATERVIFSLRDWGILAESDRRYTYRPLRRHFGASSAKIEEWLLAVALTANAAEEMPFDDLVRLPELFAFRFTITVDQIRRSPRFEVHRQGAGWDMVRNANAMVTQHGAQERLL